MRLVIKFLHLIDSLLYIAILLLIYKVDREAIILRAMPAEPPLSILMQVRKQLKQILKACIARPRFTRNKWSNSC